MEREFGSPHVGRPLMAVVRLAHMEQRLDDLERRVTLVEYVMRGWHMNDVERRVNDLERRVASMENAMRWWTGSPYEYGDGYR